MLEKSVKIDFFDFDERFYLSEGTAWVDDMIDGRFRYSGYAPQKPWRAINDRLELEEMNANTDVSSDYSSSVGVYQLPKELFIESDFLRSYTNDAEFFKTIKTVMQSKQYHEWLADISSFFKTLLRSSDNFILNGLLCDAPRPNLPTTSFDSMRSQYIGLHLDNWDKLPLHQRDKARNRVCINLGKGPRYFLFINLPVLKIIEKLQIILGSGATIHHGNIAHEFFRCYPNYPVIKIKILPGEYYMAPTENILHDGYKEEIEEIDIALSFLGFFDSPKRVSID